MRITLILLFVLWTQTLVLAENIFGRVTRVIDGDTVVLVERSSGDESRIRLQAVDAPERGQPGYTEAKNYLTTLVEGKTVRADVQKTDRYGRKVARLYVGKQDVELALIKKGLVWHYAYYNKEKKLQEAQTKAKNARRGLWKDPNPVEPHLWRKSH